MPESGRRVPVRPTNAHVGNCAARPHGLIQGHLSNVSVWLKQSNKVQKSLCLSLYTLFLIFSVDFPLLVTKGFTYAVPCLQGCPSWTVLHLVRDAQPSLPTPREEGCFSWWRWSLSATTHSNYGPCSRLSGTDALTSVWGAEAPCHKPRWQNREMQCQLEALSNCASQVS